MGLPQRYTVILPFTIADYQRALGRPLRAGETLVLGPHGGRRMKAIVPPEEAKRSHTCGTGWYRGSDDYALLQIVMADAEGRFPDDPSCDEVYKQQIFTGGHRRICSKLPGGELTH